MRLRLPHSCQPSCALCRGALVLNAEALEPLLEHAERTNRRCVYLQGTDLASSPHLSEILRSAKRRALQVALVEDGPGLGLPAKVRSLRQMGIARVYVSLPSAPAEPVEPGRRAPDVRKQALGVLLALTHDGGVEVGVHVPLSQRRARELPAVLRVQARLSIHELLISEVLREDGAPESLDAAAAVAALDRVWLAANALQVRVRLLGFDRTRYVNPPIGEPAPACDSALIELVRDGIPLASPRAGIRALGAPDHPSTVLQLAKNAQGLRDLGLELAARRCPFVDIPPCLGGTQIARPQAAAGSAMNFVKSDACPTCPFDDQCRGAPRQLDVSAAWSLRSALRPLPIWYAKPHPPRVLILSSLGGAPLLYMSTLPALGDALRRRGATVEIVSPWLPRWDPHALPPLDHEGPTPEWMGTADVEAWLGKHDLGGFDLVVTSDFPTARVALAAGSLSAAARIVVPDFHMLETMDLALESWLAPGARAADGGWWPSDQLILESGFPGYLQLYLNYGVPLEQLAWRPFSLCPGHFPSGSDVHACDVIFSGGNHLRDLETLRASTERLPAAVHPVDLYAPGDRFEGNAHLRHRGEVDMASFCRALAHSRFIVMPLQEDTNRAAGITVVAMALMAGRPVVASGTAAIRDYVQHGFDALLVPPGDPEALADAVTQLDTDPALLSALAAGARQTGRRISTEHWAEQIVAGESLVPLSTPFGWRNW